MRLVLIGVAAISLAACDSGTVPSPADRQSGQLTNMTEIDPNLVSLNRDGLTAGSESFFFAAGQSEVNAAVARALGKASESGEIKECGAGPMEYSSYAGGLTVNFQDGSLVGWFLDEEAESITVPGGYGIGTPRAEIEAIDGFTMIEDSTLGEEFIISGQVAGFLKEDALSMLYAGTQCFFR